MKLYIFVCDQRREGYASELWAKSLEDAKLKFISQEFETDDPTDKMSQRSYDQTVDYVYEISGTDLKCNIIQQDVITLITEEEETNV